MFSYLFGEKIEEFSTNGINLIDISRDLHLNRDIVEKIMQSLEKLELPFKEQIDGKIVYFGNY